ncbi:LysM peptidoglycan-binding domain-containing protein [Babesia caballi]|uniref:LysM peptidoglycan-binding domain-containing protein n=1 Tax=Babesia caballi TaxID=5871 RepID=A0AAV4LUX2_BABCB|nr:LysM peptidoglycan-binding domain-containing protein [Babesia caballi]
MSGRANRLYPTATPLCNRIRSFVNRSRPPVLKEPRGESDASSRAKQTDANQAPKNEACREVNLREKLVQQKKALHRALKRLQSRLALFKVFARYRELRRSHGSLSAVRRYLSEKSLKFGATRRNALRVKRMKELRDKVINKSTEVSPRPARNTQPAVEHHGHVRHEEVRKAGRGNIFRVGTGHRAADDAQRIRRHPHPHEHPHVQRVSLQQRSAPAARADQRHPFPSPRHGQQRRAVHRGIYRNQGGRATQATRLDFARVGRESCEETPVAAFLRGDLYTQRGSQTGRIASQSSGLARQINGNV